GLVRRGRATGGETQAPQFFDLGRVLLAVRAPRGRRRRRARLRATVPRPPYGTARSRRTAREPTRVTTEDDFQNALDADPADWQTRLVFADWLQERGDVRAEGYRALGRTRFYPYVHNPKPDVHDE